MEKTFKIEERPEGFVYIESTSFPVEPNVFCLKRNIQTVELIFKTKEMLEDYLVSEREKKEIVKAQLSYSLTQSDEELKKIDVLAYTNNLRKFKTKK